MKYDKTIEKASEADAYMMVSIHNGNLSIRGDAKDDQLLVILEGLLETVTEKLKDDEEGKKTMAFMYLLASEYLSENIGDPMQVIIDELNDLSKSIKRTREEKRHDDVELLHYISVMIYEDMLDLEDKGGLDALTRALGMQEAIDIIKRYKEANYD